jgi:hypothetical protein
LKFLRTLRLDPSDRFVFERAAEPGEWAIPGSFCFMGIAPLLLEGKQHQAFRAGFLGLQSFGWSTLVVIVPIRDSELAAVQQALAQHLLMHHGAPDAATAREAAASEIAFTLEIADRPEQTVVAMARTFDASGDIREAFRTIRPRPGADDVANGGFRVIEWADEDPEVVEQVDLLKLRDGSS